METSEIIALRPDKNRMDARRPYHYLHEREVGEDGKIKEVNTVFLTNRECPFKCVMCDLWKNTLDKAVKEGDIAGQIKYALSRLPAASVIKLYNSGNFFDQKAIPPADYPVIAQILAGYERVIIENHPKLCGKAAVEFQQMLSGQLEIAMGLETIHPEVLPKLNKQITKEDFGKAADFLSANSIESRAFILLNPPFLTDPDENIRWALKSITYAFECGVSSCSIIPTRAGNGAMEKLARQGHYVPPSLNALEETFGKALNRATGRVFVDLWDLKTFSQCSRCFNQRKSRLSKMNFSQQVIPEISCNYCNNE